MVLKGVPKNTDHITTAHQPEIRCSKWEGYETTGLSADDGFCPFSFTASQHAFHLSRKGLQSFKSIAPVDLDTGSLAMHCCSEQAIGLHGPSHGSAPAFGGFWLD